MSTVQCDVIADHASALPFSGRWWVVHTKSRSEKALTRILDRLGIRSFLPLAVVNRLHGGRKARVHIPLFPGYLFMNGDDDARYATLTTNRAANVIDVGDQDRFKAELSRIHQLVNSREPIDVSPTVRVGRRCRVTHGPLRGLEGVVVRRRGTCRVHVAVHVLGQGAEVETDASWLEVIEDEEPVAIRG